MKQKRAESFLIGRFDKDRNTREKNPNGVTMIMGEIHSPYIRIDKDCEYTDIDNGVYLFKTKRFTSLVKDDFRFELQIVEPVKKLKAPENEYWMTESLKVTLSEFPYGHSEETPEWKRQSIHYVMRLYEEYATFDHTPDGERKFLAFLFNRLITDPRAFFEMKFLIDKSVGNENAWRVYNERGTLPFDPKWDKLSPKFVPQHSKNRRYSSIEASVELRSTDANEVTGIDIETEEDLEKYKPYFIDGLVIKKVNGGFSVSYQIPERGTDEYWKMLKEAPVNQGFSSFCVNSGCFDMCSSITVTSPNGEDQIFYYDTDIYADYIKMIGVRKEKNFEVLDDNFKVDDFDIHTHKPGDVMSVTFYNKYGNFRGIYRASQVYQLKGKCLNALIEKTGTTIDSLRITFKKK